MASVYLSCPICHSPLTAAPYANWAIGERKQFTYLCSNKHYEKLGRVGPNHSHMEIVHPGPEVFSYTLHYLHKDKLYMIHAVLDSIVPHAKCPHLALCEIVFHQHGYDTKEIMILGRAYPINIKNDISTQCQDIFNKLKSLVVFT